MDIELTDALPYDEESAQNMAGTESAGLSLQSRIGKGRIYLLSESSVAMQGRLRRPRELGHEGEDTQDAEHDADGEEYSEELEELETIQPPPGARPNALLLRGEPIANLPTQRVFAYISSSSSSAPVPVPIGLEWVNDTNVVVVWSSTSAARRAFYALREAGTKDYDPDTEGFIPARPLPETLWPMDMRLEKAMGRLVAAQTPIVMRWAMPEDVKAKGGWANSKFYEKYGEHAGKGGQNVYNFGGPRGRKRKRGDDDEKRRLDDELDHIVDGREGRTSRERRSASPRRGNGIDDKPSRRSRSTTVREWDIGKETLTDEFGRSEYGTSGTSTRRRGRGRREHWERPSNREDEISKEDLDAELDAMRQGGE